MGTPEEPALRAGREAYVERRDEARENRIWSDSNPSEVPQPESSSDGTGGGGGEAQSEEGDDGS